MPSVGWILRALFIFASRQPLLLLIAILVGAILCGAGDGFGAPDLFYNGTPLQQFSSGGSISLLFALLVFIGFLHDADEPDVADFFGDESERLTAYFLGAFGALTLGLGSILAVRGALWLLLGSFAATLLVYLLMRVGTRERLQRFTRLAPLLLVDKLLLRLAVLSAKRKRTGTTFEDLHRLQVVLSSVLSIVLLLGHFFPEVLHAPMAVCAALGFGAAFFGAISFYFEGYSSLIVLVSGAGCFGYFWWSTPVHLDELSYERPHAIDSVKPSDLVRDGDALRAWRDQLEDRPPILVVVATSGGGIRAAVWTTAVLTTLEQEGPPDFMKHVRLIAGASGGMVGAAYVVGSMAIGQRADADRIGQDSLTPIARELALPFKPGDRGRALQQAWIANTGVALTKTFAELRSLERTGSIPTLVFAPMIVEDGRRMLFSNVDFEELLSSRGPELKGTTKTSTYSLSAFQFFRHAPETASELSLATVARLNATFPYVSPPVELPTGPPLRVVDAGYYDNYGVDLAGRWLLAHEQSWKELGVSGVLLVQIRDSLASGLRARPIDEARSAIDRVFDDLTTPPEAMLVAREASMSYRNDQLLERVALSLGTEHPCFFQTVVFEYQDKAPLSWTLTDAQRRKLTAKMSHSKTNAAKLKRIHAWWKQRKEGACE